MNNKLKLYSIKCEFLSEKFTKWELLFVETTNIINNYLKDASEWHKFDYLLENKPFEYLSSDCLNEIVFKVIYLWFPFYSCLCRGKQLLIFLKQNKLHL